MIEKSALGHILEDCLLGGLIRQLLVYSNVGFSVGIPEGWYVSTGHKFLSPIGLSIRQAVLTWLTH